MALKLKKESALNLTLEGSIGSFSVGNGKNSQNSIEVKYFLTHVGLDFSNGSNEALLSHLAPVREIFDVNNLDFDEIMQRDIDDARVSSELIPYLLDDKSVDLVKLFPPVVVVILPVKEGKNSPDDLYPEVSEEETPETQEESGKSILRSGSVGQEVFQFEQPISEGKKLKHDLVRLRLNTHKTRLVIVDGQHRAMALLALYRNLMDQWSDEKRAPFKEYYSEWTSKYIQQFNLKEINLPIILCTFPSLDSSYSGDCDLKKASRSVFLTLNKNARKVSNSRNILLDDNDLIAYLLRRCLASVKQKDVRSQFSLRIHNVELDQFGDKLKLQNPIAITGVNHLYYIVEHLLLNTDRDVTGVKPRSGNFTKRINLTTYPCLDRLNGRNTLGATTANSTSRDSFTLDSADKLGEIFDKKYSELIVAMFEKFELYEYHTREVLNLKRRIQENTDRQLLPILFDGQGMSRVFESHRQNLKDRLKNDQYNSKVPEIQAIADRLDSTAKRLDESVGEFRANRATIFAGKINELKNSGKALPVIIKWVNNLYEDILSSVAFQSALVCGFFGEFEKASLGEEILDSDNCFSEYISQINSFFAPKTYSQFKKLVNIITGEVMISPEDGLNIIPNKHTFREVVYRGEMQPDQWTKYKYLFLEIWQPSNDILKAEVLRERNKCREQIFSALYHFGRTNYCRENSKLETDVNDLETKEIFDKSFKTYSTFLKSLNTEQLIEDDMSKALSFVSATELSESSPET